MTMGRLRELVVFFLMLPIKLLGQIGQIISGLWSYVRNDFQLETFIPEWFLRLTIYAIPNALFGKTPQDQIEGSVILIGWSIATSVFTGFVTVFFVFFWGFFLLIGIIRFSDWGSSAWSRSTSISLPGKGRGGRYRTRKRK